MIVYVRSYLQSINQLINLLHAHTGIVLISKLKPVNLPSPDYCY